MNKMKIKIFTLLSLLITFSLTLSSCNSLWDDLNTLPTYTITYVSDKGTAPETKTVEQGYKLTAEDLPDLTETGYRFINWDKVVGDEITSDTTITASWIKTWTITYNSNNGTGTMEPQIFEENVPQALSENKFTREGYTFAGWATKADASTAEYTDKANYTATKDITLYAIWSVIPPARFTITYVSAYGSKPANKEVDKGYKLTAEDLPDLTETGYRFINWDKAVGNEITSDTTITASWVKTWTISYASNKTELNDKLPASKTVDEGYKLTSADLISTLTADGYRFINWDKVVGDEISSDITITANWIKTWTITYASNKTELKDKLPASKIVDEGYKLTSADLSTLTADGYNFKGWDKSVGDVISSDTTITATWKKLVTISYSSTYGTKPDNKTVEEGYKLVAEDLKLLPETDTMYCDSWDKTVGTEITADTTITANWETIVYLKKLASISEINSNIEKIVFSMDSYTGAATPIACADNSTNSAIPTDYFKGGLTDGTTAGQYILTIYGNGHRIYAPEDSKQLFNGFSKVTNIEFNNFYTSKVTNMSQMFYSCKLLASLDLSSFDTSAVTNMMGMFSNCEALTSPDLSSFNTSSVTNMSAMFMGCKAFTSLDLSSFDTSNVTTMQNMFQTCTNLSSLDISSFTTSAVTNMANMFYNCNAIESLDVSKFDTSKVTNMQQMFANCYGLEELDLSGFDTSEVTDMSLMFYCTDTDKSNLKKIIFTSKFKTDKVTTVKQMFYRCDKLTELDISSFSSSAIINIEQMFSTCSELKTIYASSGFDLSGLTSNNTNVFSGDTKLKGGNDTTCDGTNNIDNAYARIDEGTSNPGYFTLKQ